MVPIVGYERYLITRDGRVYATHLHKFLSPYSNGLGYLAVKLSDGKRRKQFYIHRLVAGAYIGSCEDYDVNHKDGVKANNTVGNLEVVTHQENMQHAFDNQLLGGCVQQYFSETAKTVW